MDIRRAVPALMVASIAASCLVSPADGQSRARRSTAKARAAVPSPAVATVNGEPIGRQEVFGYLLRSQNAQLNATNPLLAGAGRARPLADSVGALVLRKMMAAPSAPVTVTRSDISAWVFKDKPPVLVNAVQMLIQEKVIEQEARKRGIVAAPADVTARFHESIAPLGQRFNMTGASDEQIAHAIGIPLEDTRKNVRASILLRKLVEKDLEAKLGHPVGPGDFVEASHILVRVGEADPTKKEKAFADARTKIEGYAADIKSNKITFEKAAETYSDDAASKFQKGSLGLFMRGQMVPEFDKVAFGEDVGKISDPVRSPFGWHLIRVDRLGKDATPAERDRVLQQNLQNRMNAYMQDLMRKAKITNTVPPPAPQMQPGPGPMRRGQ